ncbi:MAG: hypothetical protein JXB46_03890, partial [Candidatus Eisenbacteria bacterium]|nr:hypothetical protein [Candidatus Eisenbacteria bacterium]
MAPGPTPQTKATAAVVFAAVASVCSCGTDGGGGGSDARERGFMFHVDLVGHESHMTNELRAYKADLEENMAWTAPPYFWRTLEPQDDFFDWSEFDRFVADHPDTYRVLNMGPGFVPTGDGDFRMCGEPPAW